MARIKIFDTNAKKWVYADKSISKAPVKGVDYWTQADQNAIIQQVIDLLGGTPVYGTVDAENNIVLSGNLAEGIYTLKYEDADGNVTVIGALNHTREEATYTNWIPLSTIAPDSTEIYNGKGYKENTRWSSSSLSEIDVTGVYVTGCIQCDPGDTIYLKNIRMNKNDTASNVRHFCYYSGSGNNWTSQDIAAEVKFNAVWDSDGNLMQFTIPNGFSAVCFRLNTSYIGPDSILTINEEITGGKPDSGSIVLTWTDGVKLDKDTGVEGSGDGYGASQHIELEDGYTYTFNQLDNGYGTTYGGANICYYDADGNGLGYELLWDSMSGTNSKTLTPIAGAKTFRVRLYYGSGGYSSIQYFTLTYEKTV